VAKKNETFNDIVARLDVEPGKLNTLMLGLRANGTRSCPSPPWDPHNAYRVTLVNEKPQIQKRLASGEWVPAELHPRQAASEQFTAAGLPTAVRIFVSHSSEDVEMATKLVLLLEASVAIPDRSLRCTSVPGYKLEAGDDRAEVLRSNTGCTTFK
jgi:hypothetical protein